MSTTQKTDAKKKLEDLRKETESNCREAIKESIQNQIVSEFGELKVRGARARFCDKQGRFTTQYLGVGSYIVDHLIGILTEILAETTLKERKES